MPLVQRAHLRSDQEPPVEPSFRARAAPPGQVKDGQRRPQKQQVRQRLPVGGPIAPASAAAAASAGSEQRQAEAGQPAEDHERLAGRRNADGEGGLYRGR